MFKEKKMYQPYKEYVYATNVKGSKKASSYLRALDMLGEILIVSGGPFKNIKDIWQVASVNTIQSLYEYILDQQKSGIIFNTGHSSSYWRNGYYSAALKSFRNFLVEHKYKQELFEVYNLTLEFSSENFDIEIESKEVLIEGVEKKEGKDILREVKTRVGQSVFRKKILEIYNDQCCITGLNIPQVNRASHIIPWSQKKETRLDLSNGLCLSATYDAAFDKNMFSLDNHYRIVLSRDIKEHYTKQVVQDYFHKIEGKKIQLPIRDKPNLEYLKQHRKVMM